MPAPVNGRFNFPGWKNHPERIHRADQAIRADHTFQGHFHQLTLGPNWSVNGSLIGPTAYGLKLGFAPERPQQLMRFIDSQRGFTISAPILTD